MMSRDCCQSGKRQYQCAGKKWPDQFLIKKQSLAGYKSSRDHHQTKDRTNQIKTHPAKLHQIEKKHTGYQGFTFALFSFNRNCTIRLIRLAGNGSLWGNCIADLLTLYLLSSSLNSASKASLKG